MKILALQSKKGFYIHTDENEGNSNYYKKDLGKLLFNGNHPEKTFKKYWYFIEKKPKKIEKIVTQPNTNYRYELKNPKDFPKLKKVYLKEEVEIEIDDYETGYTEAFRDIQSLYEYKSDPQPDIHEEIDFEFIVIGEVEEINEPIPFSYNVYRTRWTHEGTRELTSADIKNNLFTEISAPDILHHLKPCKLSSKQSYDIIRLFVKENIDNSVAEITSDYDFCFAVKKKIELFEKEKYEVDINNNFFSKRKRQPKYETRYRKSRCVVIFEMTHDQQNYKGYTVIKGFEGENLEDLKNNIDKYLNSLIKEINKPLVDCPNCKGSGVISEK